MSEVARLTGPIYVAGHRGLAGSAILEELKRRGYRDLVTASHADLDLTDAARVDAFFASAKPCSVFLAAARVGGILANSTYPAEFITENLAIQSNVIQAAHRHGVRKLLFLGSSCIYPRDAPQPMHEEYLLTGPIEPTNEAYAIAKIAGIKMCAAYNRQYQTDYLCVMPTNLYGKGDTYDLQNSHVLPALVRKAHEAKMRGAAELVVWGTGTPRREFMHADDLGRASVYLMEHCSARELGEFVNVGTGSDVAIAELAELICRIVGFAGHLRFDTTKPDGSPRKLLDVSRLKALGWTASIGLKEGIRDAYADFLERVAKNT
ncbi:MAG: GDP-L-fucose synthase [Burkholderiaceae bacterium]|jgi:GDP-L-fucose synthase